MDTYLPIACVINLLRGAGGALQGRLMLLQRSIPLYLQGSMQTWGINVSNSISWNGPISAQSHPPRTRSVIDGLRTSNLFG